MAIQTENLKGLPAHGCNDSRGNNTVAVEKGWWALYAGGLALHLADGQSGAAEGQPWFGPLQTLVSPGKETSSS